MRVFREDIVQTLQFLDHYMQISGIVLDWVNVDADTEEPPDGDVVEYMAAQADVFRVTRTCIIQYSRVY